MPTGRAVSEEGLRPGQFPLEVALLATGSTAIHLGLSLHDEVGSAVAVLALSRLGGCGHPLPVCRAHASLALLIVLSTIGAQVASKRILRAKSQTLPTFCGKFEHGRVSFGSPGAAEGTNRAPGSPAGLLAWPRRAQLGNYDHRRSPRGSWRSRGSSYSRELGAHCSNPIVSGKNVK